MTSYTRKKLLASLTSVKTRIDSIQKYLRLSPTWNYGEEQDRAVAMDIAEASLRLYELTELLPSCVIFDERKGAIKYGQS